METTCSAMMGSWTHGMMGYGWLFQLVILLLLLLIFWWLLRGQGTIRESPKEIVQRRYAAGEITKKEYEALKKELET